MSNHKCGQDMALDQISDYCVQFHCKICEKVMRVVIDEIEEKLLFQFMSEPTSFKEQGISEN